jgi:hypothetical protein
MKTSGSLLKKEEAEIGTYVRSAKKASKSERTTEKHTLASELNCLIYLDFLSYESQQMILA